MTSPHPLAAWTVYSQIPQQRGRNGLPAEIADEDVAAYRRSRRRQRTRWTRRSSQTGSSDS